MNDILEKVRPLAFFNNYLKYGYYPIYLEEKSHIDYLLKNINLTLEFDIPYNNQIELKYLTKLNNYFLSWQMVIVILILEVECPDWCFSCNSVKLPAFMKNARLLTLLFDREVMTRTG